jgi:hypothetical protein
MKGSWTIEFSITFRCGTNCKHCYENQVADDTRFDLITTFCFGFDSDIVVSIIVGAFANDDDDDELVTYKHVVLMTAKCESMRIDTCNPMFNTNSTTSSTLSHHIDINITPTISQKHTNLLI